ncbi:universal stress protein [Actinoallomurus sp. NBC_01490]|jgi:nucleotide-binding universal stress UspA family protein|uniref:universal stress protein n=1 Tax=Actinoallomurus sp. NBC_01490 TaxID=2903557 RepID=UPI002E2EADB9|nr:universal stress protein [Actinoallomurus sp. NBC_01490]
MQVIVPGPGYVAVGHDGSPNATVALRRAAAEARRRHARLDAIRVTPRPGGLRRTPVAWLGLRKEVARLLPRLQHISTRLRIARGDTSTELCRIAKHAELLVIGARVNSRHGKPLGGATVPEILAGAACDVIVCENETADEAE